MRSGRNSSVAFILWSSTFPSLFSCWYRSWSWQRSVTALPICASLPVLCLVSRRLAPISAALLGWCLARSGGYSGSLVQQHMWGGILLAGVCWLCWMSREHISAADQGLPDIYAIALATGVGLVAWTGYRGGQLSLGEEHLTEHMPVGLRHVLGVPDGSLTSLSNPGPKTFYGARVQPIFAARCVTCHGPDKHKANLRLDSYRALMRGGKDGPVVQAGNALKAAISFVELPWLPTIVTSCQKKASEPCHRTR